MTKSTHPVIALGMITRDFDDHKTILRFLENADRYGHVINRVIVAYSHSADATTVAEVEN